MAVALRTKRWTLQELNSLPDDGNKYELVDGELFVTPPPSDHHETIAAKLTAALLPFVQAHRLGHIYRPRSVVRFRGSQVEPDLMVRREHPDARGEDSDWTRAPLPILVIEIVSGYTWRRDREHKRQLYMDAGIRDYWIVDPEEREVTAVRAGREEVVARETLTWSPDGVDASLTIELKAVF